MPPFFRFGGMHVHHFSRGRVWRVLDHFLGVSMRRLFLFLVALCLSSSALAEPPVDAFYWAHGGSGMNMGPYKDLGSACSGWAANPDGAFRAYSGRGAGSCSGTTPPRLMKASAVCLPGKSNCSEGAVTTVNGTASVVTDGICSEGSAPDKSRPRDDQCPSPCNTPSGESVHWTQKEGGVVPNSASSDSIKAPYPTKAPGCGLTGLPDVKECYSTPSGAGKQFYCSYSGTSNGMGNPVGSGAPTNDTGDVSQATGGATKSANGDPETGKCPGGTSAAGMSADGVVNCIGQGTNGGSGSAPAPTSSNTTRTTDSAGNQVDTTVTTRGNADGSTTTTTTTTTTGSDGSKSVTASSTTSATANGDKGKADAETPSLCKQHPELTMCRNSTVSGSCKATACTGDAIQCATLQHAAAMRCARDDDEQALKGSAAYTLGQGLLNGNDPMSADLPKASNAQSVAVPTLDSAGWLGGGSCFPDKSVTVMGKVITVPFSQACGVLVALRYALMVAAGLVAFRILRGAFLSE